MNEPGRMLLHYRLIEKIGEGGMGQVWKALDTTLEREVAIKMLPDGFATDPERLSRFTREAKLLAALNHPSIASIHSVHADEGTRFLVMEFVEGSPLRRRIPKGGMGWSEFIRVAVPLADALAAAHARGITHRDLKPDNVMLSGAGRVKVLDFGLARAAREQGPREMTGLDTASITGHGRIVGTVAYMSPEQAEGRPVDPRSDVFSLGIVLYEMATGRRPFTGDSPVSTLSSILRDSPPPVSKVKDGLPPGIDEVVGRCLEKSPERRYASAEEVRAALSALDHDPDRTGRRTRRTTIAIRAAVALLAAAAALASMWLWMRPSPGTTTGSGSTGPATPVPPPIAVVGFENLTDPADTGRLGRVLMGLITTDLAESGGLEVVSTARILSALRNVGGPVEGAFDLSVANDAATQAGAGLMLVGQVNEESGRIVLAAELVDTRSGRTTGSIRKEAGSARELFDLAGSIAREVRAQLGVTTASVAATPFDLAGALTSSPEAYREYSAGEQAFHLLRLPEAEQRFREAIRIDPEFAMAYYRLALTLDWAGKRAAAVESVRMGLPHAKRLPQHWQGIFRALIPYSQAEYEDAYGTLSEVLRQGKEIADVHYLLGEILTHATRLWDPREARRHFERALDLDPTFGVSLSHLLDACRMGDDLRAMQDRLDRLGGAESTDSSAWIVRLKILWAERRYENLRRAVEADPSRTLSNFQQYEYAFSLMRTGAPAAALDVYSGYTHRFGLSEATFLVGRAYLLMWEGRFQKAMEDLKRATVSLRAERLKRELAAVHLALARAHRISGATAAALASAREAVESDPLLGGGWYWRGRIALEAGLEPEAAAALEELGRVAGEIGTSEARFWHELLAAELALGGGRVEEARASLERASDRPPEYRSRPAEEALRARILEAAGDGAGAIEAGRRILDPPWLLAGEPWTPWFNWPVGEIEILPSLGALEEKAGQAERAREHYRAYLDRWGGADVAIPGVARVRSRLAGL